MPISPTDAGFATAIIDKVIQRAAAEWCEAFGIAVPESMPWRDAVWHIMGRMVMFQTHVAQEDEKAAVAADSKVASRFAYNQLVNEGEAAGSKGPGAKRGKDGHVQLSSGDDFFSAPLSTSGRKASGRCVQ